MFTKIYIEALMADEDLADLIWDDWHRGLLAEIEAVLLWSGVVLNTALVPEELELGTLN